MARSKYGYITPKRTPYVKRARTSSRMSLSTSPSAMLARLSRSGVGSTAASQLADAAIRMITNAASKSSSASVSRPKTSMKSTSVARKGSKTSTYRGSSYLGGKIKRGKRYSRKIKVNGKYTPYGIEQKGITLATEHRALATTAGAETVGIGHTSLPPKFAAINMFRALIKYIMERLGCHVRDYGAIMVPNYGFVVGDKFELYYYFGATSTTAVSYTLNVGNTTTFDSIAADLSSNIGNVLTTNDDRIDSIVFTPASGSKWSAANLQLANLKIAVHTKTSLKLQNITVENSGDDEDDVTNIPLQGMCYTCKGNNFVRKANNEIIDGLFDQFNEHTIYKAWLKSDFGTLSGTSVGFYNAAAANTGSSQTTFFKTSELPKPWEVNNCITSRKFYINPGNIKTSVLTQTFEMTLQSFFKMLYNYGNTNNTFLQYDEKLGKTNFIILEKLVGRPSTASNDIKLWVENEFRQSMVVFGRDKTYTLPITYQQNKD